MSHYSSRKKKKSLQRGDKIVLKYGIPATILVAILIQLTVSGIPNLINSIIDKVEKESERSRKILMSAVKTEKLKKTRSQEDQHIFQGNNGVRGGAPKSFNSLSKEDAEELLSKYRQGTNDDIDNTYKYIEEKNKTNEIEEYQKLFKEELE
ncbi:MAG: hypothetical protein JXR87_09540 [Candidatus Marinimicrobia bacterium]|nr:hypothetical protein [Candidatus Neomarinimicrobiota bacterium]